MSTLLTDPRSTVAVSLSAVDARPIDLPGAPIPCRQAILERFAAM